MRHLQGQAKGHLTFKLKLQLGHIGVIGGA